MLSERYARNLPLIGAEGQKKLLQSKVLVVGAGGLGCPVLLYLAAAGVGTLGICDGDEIHLSNLNRQVLYCEADLHRPKARVAKEKLELQNEDCRFEVQETMITPQTAQEICQSYDVVVDCVDNLETRFWLNDACVALQKPLVHGGVSKFYGQQMTVIPGGACLRCALPPLTEKEQGEAFANKEDPNNGILGATAGFLGSIEALEVIKLLLGLPVNSNAISYYDFLQNDFDTVGVKPNPDCICQTGKK